MSCILPLLEKCLSSDNNIRAIAEREYQHLSQNASKDTISSLLDVLQAPITTKSEYSDPFDVSDQVRSLAVVMLSKMIGDTCPSWVELSSVEQDTVLTKLFESYRVISGSTSIIANTEGPSLHNSSSSVKTNRLLGVQNQMADLIGRCATSWNQTVENFINGLDQTNEACLRSLFMLLGKLSEHQIDMSMKMVEIRQMLIYGMQQNVSLFSRVYALKCCLDIILSVDGYYDEDTELNTITRGSSNNNTENMKKRNNSLLLDLGDIVFEAFNSIFTNRDNLQSIQEGLAIRILEKFIDLSDRNPSFLTSNLRGFMDILLFILIKGEEELSISNIEIQNLALENILSICTSTPSSTRRIQSSFALSNNFSSFPQYLLSLLCEIASDVDDDDVTEWNETMDFTISDNRGHVNDMTGPTAEEGLCRILEALGSKTMVPLCMNDILPPLLSSADWKKHRVGQVLLREVILCCSKDKTVIKSKPDIISSILNSIAVGSSNGNPRLCSEALWSLICFFETFPNSYPISNLSPLLETLSSLIGGNELPLKLKGVAVVALTSILDDIVNSEDDDVDEQVAENNEEEISSFSGTYQCKLQTVTNFMDSLLTGLCTCIQDDIPLELQEHALQGVAAVARTCQGDFGRHYEFFMSGIKRLLSQSSSESFANSALDCISQMRGAGSQVPQEVFLNDVTEVLQWLFSGTKEAQRSNSNCGTSRCIVSADILGPAAVALSKALNASFVDFLPDLVPELLLATEKDSMFTMEDATGEETSLEETDEGIQTVIDIKGVGKKRFTVNTHATAEVRAALDSLEGLCSNLRDLFLPYVTPVLEKALTLIKFPYASQIRGAAAVCAAANLECIFCALKKGLCSVTDISNFVLNVMKDVTAALVNERSDECRNTIAESLKAVLYNLAESAGRDPDTYEWRPAVITDATQLETESIVENLLTVYSDSITRRMTFENEIETNSELDEDSNEFDERIQEEEYLQSYIVDCIGAFFRIHRQEFLPFFESKLLPFFSSLLSNSNGIPPTSIKTNIICLLDEASEYGGENAQSLLANSFGIIVENLPPIPENEGMIVPGGQIDEEESEYEEEEEDEITLMQCATYAIVQCVKKFPMIYENAENQGFKIIERLIGVLQHKNRNSDLRRSLTENAASAFGTIIIEICLKERLSIGDAILAKYGLSELWQLWLSVLPLHDDLQEAPIVHKQFFFVLENMTSYVLGTNFENTSSVLLAFCRILARCQAIDEKKQKKIEQGAEIDEEEDIIIDPVTKDKMVGIFRNAFSLVPPGVADQNLSVLSMKQKNLLQKYNCL